MSKTRTPPAKRRALGRGLDALIPSSGGSDSGGSGKRDYFSCPIENIIARRDQPRRRFDEEALEELAQSIREQGIIQPLVVRRVDEGSRGFEIIAGERRWRASQRAGLRQVPVVVQDVTGEQAFEMALVENLQREDLNPLERAEAYRRLLEDHGLKQEELAKRIGKARTTITNSLRLLALPERVQDHLAVGALSEGHARALLGAPDDDTLASLATRVLKRGLSVRQTERIVRAATAASAPVKKPTVSPQIAHLEAQLRKKLGCEVKLRDKDGKGNQGTLELRYTSADQLEGLLDKLLGQ